MCIRDRSLDSIDLKLLTALQQDATPTNQQLAAQLGISPPTCLRRVRRLREAGLIACQVAILQPEVPVSYTHLPLPKSDLV